MSPLDATNASFVMGSIVLVSSRRETPSQYSEGHNISISRLRYSANHNALDSWPIRARIASQNDELVKIHAFQKGNNNVQYGENNVFFFYFKPHKHIALHKIHKILFFLAMSYDPFNCIIMQ